MKLRNLRILAIIFLALFISIYLSSLKEDEGSETNLTSVSKDEEILVVSSLFPWYDLVKEIGGDRVKSVLLLSPGLDAHSFEPKPQDILRISQSAIFFYTNKEMEPWAKDLTQSLNNSLKIVALAEDMSQLEVEHEADHDHADEHDDNHEHEHGDPHVWLDPIIMKDMARRVKADLSEVDSQGEAIYAANLAKYLDRLSALDTDYRDTLANCQQREVIYAGHSAFAYLAERYNLDYESASGFSPNAESTPGRLIALSNSLAEKNLGYLFTDSLENQQLAEALSRSGKIEILTLKTGSNLSKADFAANLSYEDIMRYNLSQLSLGLICQ